MKRIVSAAPTWAFSALMLITGTMDLLHHPAVLETLGRLGYPAYLASILGVAKVLGALALSLPAPRWLFHAALAGFTFDLTGAFFSHLATGDLFGAPPSLLVLTFLWAATAWAARSARGSTLRPMAAA